MGIILLGIMVGLDNMAVASGLGMLGLRRSARRSFAVSCACWEALTPLAGLAIGAGLRAQIGDACQWLGPVCLVVSGLLVLNTVVRNKRDPAIWFEQPYASVALPLLLSLDNLAAGAALGAWGSALLIQAALVGIISGVLSMTGFVIGQQLRVQTTPYSGLLGGGWLIACALLLAFVT